MLRAVLLGVALGLLAACEAVDTSVGVTQDRDFTLALEVEDQLIHVGDQTPLVLRLKRTDNSNLRRGVRGGIVITTSVHGNVDMPSVPIEVEDDTTSEFVAVLVFTAVRPGVAEVRATFEGTTVLVKLLISSVDV